MTHTIADTLSVTLAQCNPTVGDLPGNAALHRRLYDHACDAGSQLVLFPELSLSGYPPEDLVLLEGFHRRMEDSVQALAEHTRRRRTAMVVGCPWRTPEGCTNSLLWLEHGKVQYRYDKHVLPNYGVFDEKRVFVPGAHAPVYDWCPPGANADAGTDATVRVGLAICEDIWDAGHIAQLQQHAPEILLVANASPFDTAKDAARSKVLRYAAHMLHVPIAYTNLTGGQDELVFDGISRIVDRRGHAYAQVPAFVEACLHTQWQRSPRQDADTHSTGSTWHCHAHRLYTPHTAKTGEAAHATTAPCDPVPSTATAPHAQSSEETLYSAMVVGLRDYVEKNGFPGVVLGLSGGIDSGLSAAVAVDALGSARVHAVMLPSVYTSQTSLDDAADCARALGIELRTLPITAAFDAVHETLTPHLKPVADATAGDLTPENLQARLRGVMLMALSNSHSWMVLSTGNKSEMAVGYATLYGDMCGGYSVLKDLYKTQVFNLSRWRNAQVPYIGKGPCTAVIPASMLSKPPTAELRPDQQDSDSLPPYDLLDAILECLIEQRLSPEDIVRQGYDAAVVAQVAHLLQRAEYKRFQAPPGVKLSPLAFGRDRRFPLTHHYKD